ncbi:MAG: hypothetical protein COA90_01440 [Gammaproteobacteria bacterium]|nr:MAG: hypothetical protein COA90_01440 [Gammaproteobacteria bacterium]
MILSKVRIAAPLLFPLLFLIIVSSSMWAALSYIKADSKHSIHKSLDTVLKVTQESLATWSENQLENVSHLSNNQEVIVLTQSLLNKENDIALEKIKQLMLGKSEQYNYVDFFIISPDRLNIASMNEANTGKESIINLYSKPFLDRAFSGEKLFIPTIGSDAPLILTYEQSQMANVFLHKKFTLFTASPIFDVNGKVIAVLTLYLEPTDSFSRLMAVGRIGDSGETYAFDKDAALITKSRFIEQLKSFSHVNGGANAEVIIHITDPGGNMLEGYIPSTKMKDRPYTLMAERVLSGNSLPYIESYRDYRGVPVFGAWWWDNRLGIGFTTEIDAEEALQPYQLTKMVFLTIFILISFLTLGLIFVPLYFQEKEKKALKNHTVDLEKAVLECTTELGKANEHLKALSETDSLTQIANRRLYEHTLEREISLAKRAMYLTDPHETVGT